jgi:hypothetical protein
MYCFTLAAENKQTPILLLEQSVGSFVGGAHIVQGVGYQEIRWTQGFTWFGLPERNTLRPRVNGVVLLCLSIRLKSRGPLVCLPFALGICPDLL